MFGSRIVNANSDAGILSAGIDVGRVRLTFVAITSKGALGEQETIEQCSSPQDIG
jgi:hypothetical protein